jgi:uncharacterized tellurite resistance protein B-like protein
MGRMIDALKNLFRPGAEPRSEVPQDVAVAALLVEAARADGVYDEAERRAVLRLLQEMFGLNPAEAAALHDQGDEAQQTAPDMVRFTRVIKMALDEGERIGLIEALWQVVLVDHDRDPHENALLRHLAPLIAVSDRDSVAARQRALALVGPEAG